MIFSQELSEADSIGMSTFIALETILVDFYDRFKSFDQESPGKMVSDYFTKIIYNKNTPSENINKLSSLTTLSVLRLYKNILNKHKKTLKIIEPPSEFLLKAFKSADLKQSYLTTSLQESIICFNLAEDYQTNCLSIFDSKLSAGSTIWELKGVLCARDQLVVPLIRCANKQWTFNSKVLKNSRSLSFSKLNSAVLELSQKGFTPISFFYFADSVDVPSETLQLSTLNQMNELRIKLKKSNLLKSKKIQIAAFREQVIKYSQSIDLFKHLRESDKKLSAGKIENVDKETELPKLVEKKVSEPKVSENYFASYESETRIGNKFDYDTVNFDQDLCSLKLKANIPQPVNSNLEGSQMLNLRNTPSLIDMVKMSSGLNTWRCDGCGNYNEVSMETLCKTCKNKKFCSGCKSLYSASIPVCFNCRTQLN